MNISNSFCQTKMGTLLILIILTVIINYCFHLYQKLIPNLIKHRVSFSSVKDASEVKDHFQTEFKSSATIMILIWTKYWGLEMIKELTLDNLNCYHKTENKFLFTTDRNLRKSAQAILFHAIDLNRTDLPETHPSDQIWIFYLQESPIYTKQYQTLNYTEYRDIFNWTMTYRRDSDVCAPYSEVIPFSELETSSKQKPYYSQAFNEESLKHKTKLIAWVVADCNSQSKWMNLANKLREFIPIDIYGRCGFMNCSRPFGPNKIAWADGSCFPEIANSYKFYLSFENSLCVDYVTEKFFNPLMYSESYILPIVYGFANYSAIAPPNSFINVNSFEKVETLAEYLLFLDRNSTEYLKYFEWRRNYSISFYDSKGWCRLIQKLSDIQSNGVANRKSYPDVNKWWQNFRSGKSPCVIPEEFSPNLYS